MRILLTSPMGNPTDTRTWSSAPANLAKALIDRGVEVVPFDSGIVGKAGKGVAAAFNVARGLPIREISRFDRVRQIRGRAVAAAARASGADHVLCTSSINVPIGLSIPYSIWIDDTVHLLEKTPMALGLGERATAAIDALDRAAFHGAAHVLPFSEHVREDIIDHYGVCADNVFAVGCGSGPIPPFTGTKTYADEGIIFVAKHQFTEKGGDLLLKAWPEILARRPQTKLTLIGNDDAIARTRPMAGVTAHSYLPWDDLVANFHRSAFLVQPMLSDPWGQVYIEAMKSRTIVISINHRALPQLTDDGANAVLIDRASPESLAQAVVSAYDMPQRTLSSMALRAQQLAVTHHGWDAVADRMLARLS